MTARVARAPGGIGTWNAPSLRRELVEKLGDIDLADAATRDRVRNEVRVPTAALDELLRALQRFGHE